MMKSAATQVSLVVAMAKNNAIGKDGAMPWHLPADLRYFKQLTMGKPIIMGRRTFEAIGRPLPGRRNFVLSRDPEFRPEGCEIFRSLETAVDKAASINSEVMVIGGAGVYGQALPGATRIYLTQVHVSSEADTFFPPLDEADWIESKREDHPADERNPCPYSFIVLERR